MSEVEAHLEDEWYELDKLANRNDRYEVEDGFNIGMRDGYSRAVQTIDILTGGDGEYRYCTVPDESHLPDPPAMLRRIVERVVTACQEPVAEQTILADFRNAIDWLESTSFKSGYCCCGDRIDAHGIGSGHSPVDDLAYSAARLQEKLLAAINRLPAMLAYATAREEAARGEALEEAAKVATAAVTYVVGEQRDLCDRIATAIRNLKGATDA